MKSVQLLSIVTVLLFLSACGHSTGDRAVSGAGIGAGVGAIGGALVGDPLGGAVVGGAVGGVAGAATSDKDVNLGKPVWR